MILLINEHYEALKLFSSYGIKSEFCEFNDILSIVLLTNVLTTHSILSRQFFYQK